MARHPDTQWAAAGVMRGGLLIEIVFALGLFAMLVMLGLPIYRDFIASQQLDNEVRVLADTLALARSEAIRHGYRVNVCKSADGIDCTDQGYWDAGFLIYTEDDGDG